MLNDPARIELQIGEQQHGFYGGGRLNLTDSLKLIFGGRLSWYKLERRGNLLAEKKAVFITLWRGRFIEGAPNLITEYT